jgi:hypothetical protein
VESDPFPVYNQSIPVEIRWSSPTSGSNAMLLDHMELGQVVYPQVQQYNVSIHPDNQTKGNTVVTFRFI